MANPMSNSLNLILFTAILLSSCSSSDSNQSEDVSKDLPYPETSNFESKPIPALVITYSVQSVEQWQEIFNAEKSQRENLKILDLGNLTSDDNPREISSFFKVPDYEIGKEYAESSELKKQLEDMGTVGEPRILYMDILQMPQKTFPQQYRMMVTHKVKDYDHWKEVFDQHEAERRQAGLELVGIGKSHSDSLEISVMFAFDDMDAARIFASSDQLKQAMEESGVVSDPVLSWYQSLNTN